MLNNKVMDRMEPPGIVRTKYSLKLKSTDVYLFSVSSVQPFQSSGRYHEDIFGVTLKTKEVTDRVRTAAKRYFL